MWRWTGRGHPSHIQARIRNPPFHVVVVVGNPVELIAGITPDDLASRINGLVEFIWQRLDRDVRCFCDFFHYVAIRATWRDRKTHVTVDEQVAKLGGL